MKKFLMCALVVPILFLSGCRNLLGLATGFTIYTHGPIRTSGGQIVSDAPLPYTNVAGQVRQWDPNYLGVYEIINTKTEGDGKKWMAMYV